MKKVAVAIGLIVLLLIVFSVGIFGRTAVTPTPTPTTPTATPQPTPTTPSTIPVKVTAQEFIANAQAGKYKIGTVIEVSASYETIATNVLIYVILGPKTNGLNIMAVWDKYDDNKIEIAYLNTGDAVRIRGEYGGIGKVDVYPYRNTDFVILTNVKFAK